MMPILRLLAACVLAVLAACQSGRTARQPAAAARAPRCATMEQVAIAAHKCWFASKDPAFKPYRMANELNSFSGPPRFLLVPAKNYRRQAAAGRAGARATRRKVEVFGPLMGEPLGARIGADVGRWSSGASSCSAAA